MTKMGHCWGVGRGLRRRERFLRWRRVEELSALLLRTPGTVLFFSKSSFRGVGDTSWAALE